MSRSLRSLIGQLSFDLVPNTVLAKTKIDLIRAIPTIFARALGLIAVEFVYQNSKTILNLQNVQFKFSVIITCCEDLYRRYCT